jgi:mycofactocin system transcriptional regulator
MMYGDDIVRFGGDEAKPSLPAIGRPPSTTRRQLQQIALDLFCQYGYDEVTVEDLATAAGISRRTFFRYFPYKADALMGDFDREVASLRQALRDSDADVPLIEAIRRAILVAHGNQFDDPVDLRRRLGLQRRYPVLLANAFMHFEIWQRAIAEFAATRLGQSLDDLLPQAIAGSVFGATNAAYQSWLEHPCTGLESTVDAALTALARGFAPTKTARRPPGGPRPRRPQKSR